ncbi:hypothetical protein KUTeg_003564 [Tegillarca granosa]|uniref:RUN domain-containing protein n=1 Tax=Tegillarca granosa TaxID=220873 RepID=A0ABQ9FMJ2_TEGGR|nr:hypothetical protein KUTeg_003564 [Tegillarca granosa]
MDNDFIDFKYIRSICIISCYFLLLYLLTAKKGIFSDKRDFWCVLESIEKLAPEAGEITASVRELPHIKTALGKARAWLRLAVMQKRLSDYFKMLIEKKDQVLSEFYESGAMMIEDEGMVIAGLLVGLNVIDCNMCIKEEDLDQPMGVIDFSLYLKESRLNDDVDSPEVESATVTNLQQKMESCTATNALMKEDLAIAKNQILQLQEENELMQTEKKFLSDGHKQQLEAAKQDIDIERETYQTSRAGLDQMCADAKKKMEEETKLRLDVEKELELQIGMKQEMEMALRILEKDIHEKQDTMISLRKQLDEIKGINLEMYQKLQVNLVNSHH